MLQQVRAITALGSSHLLVFTLLVPVLAIRSRMKLTKSTAAPLDRVQHFKTTVFTLVLFGSVSLLTASNERINLFRRPVGASVLAVAAALAMYVVAVLFMRPRWRRAVEKRTRIVHLFMPANAVERTWWITVSTLAGISEEITWRGVHPVLLTVLLGSPVAGAAVAAVTFGVADMVQGWKSAAIVSIFAAGFQTLVWLSGSLYLAMLVHVAYDITAGLAYGRLGKELGYELDDGLLPT